MRCGLGVFTHASRGSLRRYVVPIRNSLDTRIIVLISQFRRRQGSAIHVRAAFVERGRHARGIVSETEAPDIIDSITDSNET